MTHFDPLAVIISRIDVEREDLSSTLSVLESLCKSPASAKSHQERVDIAFHGYDSDPRELFEIPEVRKFVLALDDKFPYWLFFLSKAHLGLQCILWCLLPASLSKEAKARIWPQETQKLFVHRWFPAMNHVSSYAELNETDIEALTNNAMKYITTGRFSR